MTGTEMLRAVLRFEPGTLQLSQPGRWPLSIRLASWGVVAVLLVSIVGALWLVDLHQRMWQALQSEPVLQQTLVEQFRQRQHAAEYRQWVEAMDSTPSHFDGFLSEPDAPLLLDHIAHQAGLHDVQLDEARLLPEQAEDIHVRLPIRVHAVGHYAALSHFIAALGAGAFLLSFGDFELTAAPGVVDALQLHMELHAFRLSDEVAP